MGAPDLPPRFPCWCRATFSWGGETKKDLGFIEGDLIECLNAGDGLWWMGRLRRDPRAIGLFPSNFVKVLDESFQPTPTRNASPLTLTQAPKQTTPAKSTSVFRKPFQAYEKIGPDGKRLDGRDTTPESDKEKPKKKSRFAPYSSMKTAQAPTSTLQKTGSASPLKQDDGFTMPAPLPRGGAHRRQRSAVGKSPSPRPDMNHGASASPMPEQRYGVTASPTPTPSYQPYRPQSPNPERYNRAPSPAPSMHQEQFAQPTYRPVSAGPPPEAYSDFQYGSHNQSPLPSDYDNGSAYPQHTPSRGPSPNPYQQDPYSRAPSTAPSFDYQPYSRAPSLAPQHSFEDEEDLGSSPPPPPPPAHRVLYQSNRAPSAAPSPQPEAPREGSHTPIPASPNDGSHMTPSPLRDAMNDVMSSLQGMSVKEEASKDRPTSSMSKVWSPDAFDEIRAQSQEQNRAQSSLGFRPNDRYYSGQDSQPPSMPSSREGPPPPNHASRMERQLRHTQSSIFDQNGGASRPASRDEPPAPPLKGSRYGSRPTTSSSQASSGSENKYGSQRQQKPGLRSRKSAYELGKDALSRTFTTKTNQTESTNSSSATQSSTSTQLTSRSLMSGYSAGGFSATSAGSLARKKYGIGSFKRGRGEIIEEHKPTDELKRHGTRSMAGSELSGPSYHESHASIPGAVMTPVADWTKDPMESAGVLGGLGTPKGKRSGFFKKMIESARTTAKTGAANARARSGSRPSSSRTPSPTKSMFGNGSVGMAGGLAARPGSAFGNGDSAARDMGLGGGNDWMQVRRDINRSNTLSRREKDEREERCEMLDLPVLQPIDMLHEMVEGDEGLDGMPITDPTDFNTPNLALVDKSTRFVNSVPPMVAPAVLAQNYLCRPHRSDVQRLRAIFTWVAERITWEDDFEGQIDTRRVVQTKRGCSEEIALLVREMCSAVGLQAEVVRGYLKAPGETLDLETIAHPNHWWNAVTVENEWRIIDCALASPTHPRRSDYSNATSQVAEPFYFLARPMEIIYTHIPLLPEAQHLIPSVSHETLLALPCAAPPYFRHNVELTEFSTSGLHLENLETAQFNIQVPSDVEVLANISARTFAHDGDGDRFETGDSLTRPALAQPEWLSGRKRYTIKALLPPETSAGTLNIYAGKRGLMHSIKSNPHPLALALPLFHSGTTNPPFEWMTRHPTPHAQRHDLYVVGPQCKRLVVNNTFVFTVRQHPSSLERFSPDTWGTSQQTAGSASGSSTSRPVSPALSMARPGSAMSTRTLSHAGSSFSHPSSENSEGSGMTAAQLKPAKLAIQTPGQKIIRLTRKESHTLSSGAEESGLNSVWETVIKVGERGTWRALVLADRSARWCVFGEWECV
ncbi:hypothetical protein MBLNU230_g0569t1 [Neophaeotheca triangularis]